MKRIVARFRDGAMTKSKVFTLYSGGMTAENVTDPPLWRWELADSELTGLAWQPGPGARPEAPTGQVQLRFSAAAVSQAGAPGRPLHGHLGPVFLRLTGVAAAPQQGDALCQGRVYAAELSCAGQRLTHLGLAPPGADAAPGPWQLHLSLAHGGTLSLSGAWLQAWAAPDARFHESLAC